MDTLDAGWREMEASNAGYCEAAWRAVCRSQAVAEFDMVGRITWANDLFLKLIGYKLQDIIGHHHKILCDEAYAQSDEYASFWETLRRGEFSQDKFRRRRADGSELWLQATYNPIFDQWGSAQHVLKIATDITHQILLERELQANSVALQDTVHELGSVVTAISAIANKSKLLALNATIESARAGDAGRGFAVVAQEIKKLSGETKIATEQAGRLLRRHNARV